MQFLRGSEFSRYPHHRRALPFSRLRPGPAELSPAKIYETCWFIISPAWSLIRQITAYAGSEAADGEGCFRDIFLRLALSWRGGKLWFIAVFSRLGSEINPRKAPSLLKFMVCFPYCIEPGSKAPKRPLVFTLFARKKGEKEKKKRGEKIELLR